MKIFKYLAVASVAMFAACNQKENTELLNKPVDVVVSLKLPGVTRGGGSGDAMTELQDVVNHNDAASVEKIHVYLVDGTNKIVESKEFVKDGAEYNKLISSTPVGQPETTGGFKFINVDKTVKAAVVIVNPQAAIVAKGGNLSSVGELKLKSKVNEVVYVDSKNLETVGTEKFGVNPQGDKRVVKAAELQIAAAMNRFQITGTKFTKIVWKAGQKTVAEAWINTWLAAPANSGKTSADAWTAFKADANGLKGEVWDGKTDPTTLTSWSKFFKVVDVNDATRGIFMNRFSSKYSIPAYTADDPALLWAKTFVGTYNIGDGSFKPDGATEMSEVASYSSLGGFNFAGNKAAAFNFFADKITSYKKDGNAPKLVFAFNNGSEPYDPDNTYLVSESRRFLVIAGYAKTEGAEDDIDVAAGAGGYLINMDLAKLNNNQGIVVDVDPSIPAGVAPKPGGHEDIESENVNVIVRVTVEPWIAKNVYPVLQ